jgi:multiple sugar transport system ATP-binding protein
VTDAIAAPDSTGFGELDQGRLAAPGAASVSLSHVTKEFGSDTAVADLNLDVPAGEFLVILGPSGCGKTTVLRLVAGLESPTAGWISLGDRVVNDVDAKDRNVAMVFQSYALYPHLSVRRNIEFPLRARHVPPTERDRLVNNVSASLQISALLDRKPGAISGGQRQRVALARAIVRQPTVFLMDEPLSNLDAQLRVEMRAELVELHRRIETTILYVTHDQVEAMTMGDRLAIMDGGVLQQVGTPQEVHDRPANTFVARFIGSPPMNLLRGEVVASGPRDARLALTLPGGTVPLPEPLAASVRRRKLTNLVLGVRPEHLAIADTGTLGATVSLVESLGHESHVACRLGDGSLAVVRLTSSAVLPRIGDRVMLAPDSAHLYLFDPESGQRLDA